MVELDSLESAGEVEAEEEHSVVWSVSVFLLALCSYTVVLYFRHKPKAGGVDLYLPGFNFFGNRLKDQWQHMLSNPCHEQSNVTYTPGM